MKEFLLIFRDELNKPATTASPEQMQQHMESWQNWMGGIAAQNKLASPGNRLGKSQAKTVKSDGLITDGPFTEIKEFINGYIIVRAADINEAVSIAQRCPILTGGGSVEVRSPVDMNDNS